MLNILCKKLSKLFRGEAGNVVIMFAVAASVLVLAVGVAVDSSRINLVKINQQNAVDAAAASAENLSSA
jgi:Flp pilus assembly protein TadG